MSTLLFSSILTERYELLLAEQPEDVRAAQRLRFAVFNLELHEGLSAAFTTGLDADEFDEVCDHLLVRERRSGEVIGTYRLQTGANAGRALGYYSAREFDFSPFEPVRDQLVELGRACVAPDHRNQVVLGLLWKGIARYARVRGGRYLTGCSSLTTQDEASAMATYRSIENECLVGPRWRTSPCPGWECSPLAGNPVALPIPRLLRAYLSIGAKICGAPAIDREFSTVDFLTWVDLDELPQRVWQKYLT